MDCELLKKVNETLTPIDIKGKGYNTVNQRILAFWQLFPNGSIESDIVRIDDDSVIIKAIIKDNEKILATGYAREEKNSSFINKTSFIENCETSAIGRALGVLGIGAVDNIASVEELANALNNQSEKPKKTFPDKKPLTLASAKLLKIKYANGEEKLLKDLPVEQLKWISENKTGELKEGASMILEFRVKSFQEELKNE